MVQNHEPFLLICRSDLSLTRNHFLLVSLLDHFLGEFLYELRSNLVICHSPNLLGLRTNSDLIEITQCTVGVLTGTVYRVQLFAVFSV